MSKVSFDDQRLRIGFVVYGAMNRKDWREVSINDVGADPVEVERNLIPMLLTHARPERSELEIWTTTLVDECRAALARVLPMTGPELEFLDKLNGRGHIVPQLLTSDSSLQERIAHHPGLLWKAQNVRLL